MTSLTKISLHGFVLFLTNLVGVLGGFIIFKHIGGNQLTTQIPCAIVISVILFFTWYYLLHKFSVKTLFQNRKHESIGIFLAALVWNPLIIIPLHYFTQGYLIKPVNILLLMLLQIPINTLALWLANQTEYR